MVCVIGQAIDFVYGVLFVCRRVEIRAEFGERFDYIFPRRKILTTLETHVFDKMRDASQIRRFVYGSDVTERANKCLR
jgi:hypothetical protein